MERIKKAQKNGSITNQEAIEAYDALIQMQIEGVSDKATELKESSGN